MKKKEKRKTERSCDWLFADVQAKSDDEIYFEDLPSFILTGPVSVLSWIAVLYHQNQPSSH